MRRRRFGNLFREVASLENLFAAAGKALRGRSLRMPAAGFLANLEWEVVTLHRELCNDTYGPGDYNYFEITEPKRRVVAAAPFRDRVVHHAICRVIEPLWERRFIRDNYACRPGKGTHAALRRASKLAQRFEWALCCDVRRYFPSISHGVLLAALGRVIADERLMKLLRRILASHQQEESGPLADAEARHVTDVGLPIGNLTSQFFANVMLDPLDHYVTEQLRAGGYVRYMDDFLVFGDSRGDLRAMGKRIKKKLETLQLEIHPDKYRLVRTRHGVDFVGFSVFSDGRVRLREKSVKNFRRRYQSLLWKTHQGHVKPSAVTASVKSWVAHARHAQSEPLRSALLRKPRRSSRVKDGTAVCGGRGSEG